MATYIDITGKIKNEKKFIKFGGKTFKVDDRKNTILQVYALINENADASPEMIDKVIELTLGREALKAFNNLSFGDYLIPFFAVMACVQNKTYEEVEASFRKSR